MMESSVSVVLSNDTLPLKSSCANCSLTLSATSYVGAYTVSGSSFSVYQALQFVFFQGQEITDDQSAFTFLKLCTSCGELFEELLKVYMRFCRVSAIGSYIYSRINNLLKISSENDQEPEPEMPIKVEPSDAEDAQDFLVTGDSNLFQSSAAIFDDSVPPLRRSRRIARGGNLKQKISQEEKDVKSENEEDDFADIDEHSSTGKNEDSELNLPKVKKVKRLPGIRRKFKKGTFRLPKKNKKRLTAEPIPKKFKCETCNEAFTTAKGLEMHESGHNGERPFACEVCSNRKFRTPQRLMVHNRRSHPEKYTYKRRRPRRIGYSEEEKILLRYSDFKCDACVDVCFESYKEWLLHQQAIHGMDIEFAPLKSDETLAPRSGHLRPCPQCGVKLKTNQGVLRHIKCVHLHIRPFACDLCQKSFLSQQAVLNHVETVHGDGGRDFLCSLCADSFKSKGTLQIHEKIHYNLLPKRYECKKCDAKFTLKSTLNKHQSTHITERPFVCEECGRSYKTKAHLEGHQRGIHIKKYILDQICEFCGKAYAFKKDIKNHLISVHKLSEIEAKASAKIATRGVFRVLPNGDRVTEKKTTKPKSCHLCGRAYVRREQLFTHLLSVHGKSQEEAKGITGLDTKRNLLPGTSDVGRRTTRRKPSKDSCPVPINMTNPISFHW